MTYFARKSIRVSIGITVFTVVAIALTAFQLASRFGLTSIVGMAPGFGIGRWRQIGLPFMQGTSSNPAGFVLGLLIVLFIDLPSRRRPIIKFALFILLVAALLLTVSRTNIIALAAVIAFRFALKAISGERFLLIFLIITVLVVVMFVVLTTIVARDSVLWKVLQIVVNPQGIFSINSFWLRYALLWPTAINAWLSNAGTLLFGLGIGFMATVDGTIPWLLANTGITGLALFTLFWYGALLKRWPGFRTVRLLLLFTLINGIAADTLIMSYRAMQTYTLVVVFAAFAGDGTRKSGARLDGKDQP